jgi:hypothetical protein
LLSAYSVSRSVSQRAHFNREDGGSRFLRNIGTRQQGYSVTAQKTAIETICYLAIK